MPIEVGGVQMEYPLILGAGTVKYPSQLRQYNRRDLSIGAITLGSITPEPSDGNVGTLFFPDDFGGLLSLEAGLNSFGMPNEGYEKVFRELKKITFTHMPPLIVSIASDVETLFLQGIRLANESPAIKAIKLNISCPNKGGLPLGFDLEALDSLLRKAKHLKLSKPLWIKAPRYVTQQELKDFARQYTKFDFSDTPTVDESFINEFARLIGEHSNIVKALVVANTLGNVKYRQEDGKTVTTPNEGRAGLSGPLVRELSISLIMKLAGRLGHRVDFIGSGGVLTGRDAMVYLRHEEVLAVCCTSGPFWYGDGPKFCTNLVEKSGELQAYLTNCLV